MDRPWSDLTTVDSTSIARSLAALGNPQRVQIVQLLVRGLATTAELTARLDEPTPFVSSTSSRC
jgi:DNA-binding transcriptional ArsR family regulator